jgi:outer membrane receptor for ferrienterochelin and colicin
MRAISVAVLGLLACACLFLAANAVRADDLADEADLQFQLGADRYKEGDYRGALEHFLASNRLVPNRNVSFNIARSYEHLGSYPEAFRYYEQALNGETDGAAKARVETAISQIKPNVAVLKVVTNPPGAVIFIDRRDLGSRGNSPRTLGLSPGRYRIIADMPGYEPATSEPIDASAAAERVVALTLEPKIEGLTGNLVINADERGAMIEIDDRARSFTPAIVTVPAGTHRVRVTMKGFRPIERTVFAKPAEETRVDLVLTQDDAVTAASRITESVEDAPSSVSIVRSEELRAMAYPTIAEALRGVRGVYTANDRAYTSVGFRGLGRPGDYGNRVLVLLDGQPTNDNWVGSSYVGFDARTDLEDIERIEVVRGPGSVLYGTNAFSGVVNLVTRGTEGKTSGEVGVSSVDYGVARGRARYNLTLGKDASIWTSAAFAQGAGRDFHFPEYAQSPQDLAGNARNVDGFKSATVNGRATAGPLTALWLLTSRSKTVPTAEYDTIFGDRRFRQADTRELLEVRFEPEVSKQLQLMSRIHLNHYEFSGHYPHTLADGGLEHDTFLGSWIGLEQRLLLTPTDGLRITVGGETQQHFQATQRAQNEDSPNPFLDESRTYNLGAAYALLDLALSRRVRLSGGSRFDRYSTFGSSNNPRAALIVHPYDAGNLKVMFGKAFRAPSIYELYYNDGGQTQTTSPALKPESMYSGEIEFSHRFSPTVSTTVACYGAFAKDLIVIRGKGTPDDLLHYDNAAAPVFTLGTELEVRREWRQGWMLGAAYSMQRSRYLASSAAEHIVTTKQSADLREVPNAPAHLFSLRGAAPILSRALLASTRLALESGRYDRHEEASDPVRQSRTEPAVVWDLVLSGEEQRWGVRYAVGVYNAFDWRYSVPVSNEFRQNAIVQNGRTFLLSCGATF